MFAIDRTGHKNEQCNPLQLIKADTRTEIKVRVDDDKIIVSYDNEEVCRKQWPSGSKTIYYKNRNFWISDPWWSEPYNSHIDSLTYTPSMSTQVCVINQLIKHYHFLCSPSCVTSSWKQVGKCCASGKLLWSKTILVSPYNGGKDCGNIYELRNCQIQQCQDSKFKYFGVRLTWFEAKDACIKSGGRLAVPDNQRENDQIYKKLGQDTWLGFQNLKVRCAVSGFLSRV